MNPEDLGVIGDLSSWTTREPMALTALLIASILLVRVVALLAVRGRTDVLSDRQRWWITFIRNASNALIVVSIVGVWANEIGEFALSITAIAVALAIALKELILCFSGATWRGVSGAFGVGDWIEIAGHSGEVIDESAFVTVLQEVDRSDFRYTGRTITLPNSLLLSQPVVNHNFRKRFLHHEFSMHTEPARDALDIRDQVLTALTEVSREFADVGRRYTATIEKHAGVRLPVVDPEVRIETTELAKMVYRCSLFCPRERAVEIEQIAYRAMLEAGGVRPIGK